MKITSRLKIEQIKDTVLKNIYKPMNCINKQTNQIKIKRYECFREKAISMSFEEVAKRTTKLIIKDLLKHHLITNYKIEIELADWCDTNYCIETVLQYQMHQKKDKKLSTYAYNIKTDEIPDYNVRMYISISKLLIKSGCHVDYEIREHYKYNCENYIKTMIISLRG